MEKRIYEIGKRLLSKHEIHWYGIGWWLDNNSSEMYKDGMYFHSVCKPMPLYASNGSRSTKEAIWFAIKLFLPLQRQRFDVIVCEQFPYLSCFTSRVVSSLRRSNLVIDWHEIWGEYWFEYQGSKGMIGLAIEKLVSKLTSNNIAVSKATRARLELLTGSQVKLFPNGVDLDLIERVNPSNEQFDFIFAGRLIEEKGVDLLLRAMKRVLACNPNLNCLVLGEGPEKKSLQTLATSLGIESSITFVGRLEDYERVVSYMKSSKVFVLPSKREGFAIVAIEANACGIPVVTTNYPMNAAKDHINFLSGLVCEPTPEKLSSGMLSALEKHEEMKSACRENAKHYSWDSIVRDIEIYFSHLSTT